MAKSEDAQFADITDFANPKAAFALVPNHAFHVLGDNISEKNRKKGNNSQNSK